MSPKTFINPNTHCSYTISVKLKHGGTRQGKSFENWLHSVIMKLYKLNLEMFLGQNMSCQWSGGDKRNKK